MASPDNSPSRDNHIAIRRKRDGMFVRDRFGKTGTVPRFAKSVSAAHMMVRVDLGDDLSDYEFIPRSQIR